MTSQDRIQQAKSILQKQGYTPQPTAQVDSSRVERARQILQSQSVPVSQPSTSDKVAQGVVQGFKQAGQSVLGVGKGILNTLNNFSLLGQKALQKITGAKSQPASLPKAAVTPTPAQKPAFVGEQIGEFFLPSGMTGKLTKTLDTAVGASKLAKAGQLAVKASGRAVIEGTAAGAVRLGQTASGKEALKAGATAGVLAGTANVAGGALRKARIPEWFYSKIFRTSSDDMLQELKTVGTANLKKTNPELYHQLIETGAVKIDTAGKPILNETLAKEALDRGLKGSIKNMANEVVKNTYQSESTAQKLVATHAKPIKIEPQYTKLLKEVADDYQDVGFGEISKKANDILKKIQNGQTDASTGLELRRFLDGMRTRASFSPTTKLTQTQGNFKTLADKMRERLATEVKGLKPVMNEYRFNIEALDSLAKEAAKRGNREVVSLLDAMFFGSGMAGGSPALGASLGVARRILNSPAGTTSIGSSLNSLGIGTSKLGKLVKGSAAYLNSKGSPPTQGN